jgi:hypothetical protein
MNSPREPPHPFLDRKVEMYEEWHREYMDTPHDQAYFQSCKPPDGNRPPFVRGALSRGNRRLFSAAIQLSTGHPVTPSSARIQNRFRSSAGDNTTCPCSDPHDPIQHSVGKTRHPYIRCRRFRTRRHRAFRDPSGPPSWPFIFTSFIVAVAPSSQNSCGLTHDLLYLIHLSLVDPRPDLGMRSSEPVPHRTRLMRLRSHLLHFPPVPCLALVFYDFTA